MKTATQYDDLVDNVVGLQTKAIDTWFGNQSNGVDLKWDMKTHPAADLVKELMTQMFKVPSEMAKFSLIFSNADQLEAECINPYFDALNSLINDSLKYQNDMMQDYFTYWTDMEKVWMAPWVQYDKKLGYRTFDGWSQLTQQFFKAWEEVIDKTMDTEKNMLDKLMKTTKAKVAAH